MSWERKRIELKRAESRKPHGYSDGADESVNRACCLLAFLEGLTCCWFPLLAVIIVTALTAMIQR